MSPKTNEEYVLDLIERFKTKDPKLALKLRNNCGGLSLCRLDIEYFLENTSKSEQMIYLKFLKKIKGSNLSRIYLRYQLWSIIMNNGRYTRDFNKYWLVAFLENDEDYADLDCLKKLISLTADYYDVISSEYDCYLRLTFTPSSVDVDYANIPYSYIKRKIDITKNFLNGDI